MKSRIIGGIEVAPPCCIVCGKEKPDGENVPGWVYLANAEPVAALACSEACTRTAVERHRRTGRVDVAVVKP
jgi:hypothetical protein